jgi:hypothetical protein
MTGPRARVPASIRTLPLISLPNFTTAAANKDLSTTVYSQPTDGLDYDRAPRANTIRRFDYTQTQAYRTSRSNTIAHPIRFRMSAYRLLATRFCCHYHSASFNATEQWSLLQRLSAYCNRGIFHTGPTGYSLRYRSSINLHLSSPSRRLPILSSVRRSTLELESPAHISADDASGLPNLNIHRYL